MKSLLDVETLLRRKRDGEATWARLCNRSKIVVWFMGGEIYTWVDSSEERIWTEKEWRTKETSSTPASLLTQQIGCWLDREARDAIFSFYSARAFNWFNEGNFIGFLMLISCDQRRLAQCDVEAKFNCARLKSGANGREKVRVEWTRGLWSTQKVKPWTFFGSVHLKLDPKSWRRSSVRREKRELQLLLQNARKRASFEALRSQFEFQIKFQCKEKRKILSKSSSCELKWACHACHSAYSVS